MDVSPWPHTLQCACSTHLACFTHSFPPPPSTDLGGSVTAALAAASIVFRNQNDTDYAKRLLDKAQEVGGACRGGNSFC